jgi:hypothetical protein
MTLKAKLIIVGVAVGIVISFVAHRYLGCAEVVLEHLTACAVVPAACLIKGTAGFFSSLLGS